METWKTNLDETKKRYIEWWNHKGIILNMWEHFQEGVKPHADIPAPSPAKDLNQKWFDPQWRAEYLDWYVAHSSLKADILPVANTQLGYLARGGRHMEIRKKAGKETLHYMDEPPREGVRPCANYMYESLMDSNYDEIICVVLTGMGADGTEGIRHLKEKKKVTVIAQDEETCTVYGMPKSVVQAQLADKILPLTQIAGEITKNVGVI